MSNLSLCDVHEELGVTSSSLWESTIYRYLTYIRYPAPAVFLPLEVQSIDFLRTEGIARGACSWPFLVAHGRPGRLLGALGCFLIKFLS